MLNNGHFMPYMMVYVLNSKVTSQNGPRCFPKYGAVQTGKLLCDVHTNDRYHRLCFPTMDCVIVMYTHTDFVSRLWTVSNKFDSLFTPVSLVSVNKPKSKSSTRDNLFCHMGQVMRKCVLCYMRTTKVQISLRIRAV